MDRSGNDIISLGIPINLESGFADLQYGDVFKHAVIMGGTGKGKSTLLLNLMRQLEGAKIILDPYGSLAQTAYALHPGARYISKKTPLPLNPLRRDHLSLSESANELAEVLNTATKVTNQEQVATTVLMARLIRNAVRVGIKDLKKLSDVFYYEEERRKIQDHFWREFDATDRKGWYKYRDERDSAKRISARLSLLTEDEHLYSFLQSGYDFDLKGIVQNGEVYIFDFRGFDDFITAFIGGLVATYVKSYYLHQAREQGPPLFFFVDEVHLFFSPLFSRFLTDARRYNIATFLTLHTKSQVSREFADILDHVIHTKIALRDGFQADISIVEKDNRVLLDPPPDIDPKDIPVSPRYNFLADRWITV